MNHTGTVFHLTVNSNHGSFSIGFNLVRPTYDLE